VLSHDYQEKCRYEQPTPSDEPEELVVPKSLRDRPRREAEPASRKIELASHVKTVSWILPVEDEAQAVFFTALKINLETLIYKPLCKDEAVILDVATYFQIRGK
jgi:hypothetical protein